MNFSPQVVTLSFQLYLFFSVVFLNDHFQATVCLLFVLLQLMTIAVAMTLFKCTKCSGVIETSCRNLNQTTGLVYVCMLFCKTSCEIYMQYSYPIFIWSPAVTLTQTLLRLYLLPLPLAALNVNQQVQYTYINCDPKYCGHVASRAVIKSALST